MDRVLTALAAAREILALAPEAVSIVRALVRLLSGHAPSVQRRAMALAFAAVEDALAASIRGAR